jgi:hypothetical protein
MSALKHQMSAIPRVSPGQRKKVSALRIAQFLEGRKARADFKAFDKIMRRRRGKLPRKGDEMPG